MHQFCQPNTRWKWIVGLIATGLVVLIILVAAVVLLVDWRSGKHSSNSAVAGKDRLWRRFSSLESTNQAVKMTAADVLKASTRQGLCVIQCLDRVSINTIFSLQISIVVSLALSVLSTRTQRRKSGRDLQENLELLFGEQSVCVGCVYHFTAAACQTCSISSL